ncbi:MAG: NYN domain-containing protein [Gammaproteobacteria bacterium]|nr:NYN domain-containing protein [Gammaproteobacteria bacterium]
MNQGTKQEVNKVKAGKKIAIFVDVQNIYYTTRQAYGRQFNYRKLWQKISSEGNIITANAYATHRGDDKQLKFQNALKQIGFTIRLKPYIQRSDGSAKGDWDVGITIDILDAAKEVDTVILLSGDGDFDLLLEKIKRDDHVCAEVYGVPSLTSSSLIDSASIYHRIDEDLLL